MKYIKKYESFESRPEVILHSNLCKFLEKIDPSKFLVKHAYQERGYNSNETLSFEVIKQGRNMALWESKSTTAFVIRVLPVSDKKLIDERIKPKIKVSLDSCYWCEDKDTVPLLVNFIKDTFKKYSYFTKNMPYYNQAALGPGAMKCDFFIHSADINAIMDELNNNFEIYKDTTKYNL